MLFNLLNFTKKYLDMGKSLSDAFSDFARFNGYTAKSVKKCFVVAIKGFEHHPKLAKELEIDLNFFNNPANTFNLYSVKKFLENNGNDADKCFFALCLGDKSQAISLKKRFDDFFPNFNYKTNTKPIPKKTKGYLLQLLSKNYPTTYPTLKS
ncbi:MAG: hypothetical protein IKV38_03535 [Clostridia bacterium]|nr:hypothetical protein [Clostridia bacterium]